MNKLPEGITLQLYLCQTGSDRIVLFSSSKKWLHPLFELEEFLSLHEKYGSVASRENLLLRDTIIGRAAAFLIVRMGIRRVETDLISRRDIPLFEKHDVHVTANKTIDAIDCMTEELLKDYSDPDEVYAILVERRRVALKAPNAVSVWWLKSIPSSVRQK